MINDDFNCNKTIAHLLVPHNSNLIEYLLVVLSMIELLK